MATNERKAQSIPDNPAAIADKDGDYPRVSAKRARKTCSDECYFTETDGEGHWYGGKENRQ